MRLGWWVGRDHVEPVQDRLVRTRPTAGGLGAVPRCARCRPAPSNILSIVLILSMPGRPSSSTHLQQGAEHRQRIAHGVSRGFRAFGRSSPGGAQDSMGGTAAPNLSMPFGVRIPFPTRSTGRRCRANPGLSAEGYAGWGLPAYRRSRRRVGAPGLQTEPATGGGTRPAEEGATGDRELPPQAMRSLMTRHSSTPVRRASRPWTRTVKRSCWMPRRCITVAWKSRMCTGSLTMLYEKSSVSP